MSRTLVLLRHGKSDWSADVDDRDRPLAKRGRRAAKLAGQVLAQAGLAPEAAVTSPAVRTVSTLNLAMESGGWKCPVRVSEALYGGGPTEVLDEIRAQADDAFVALFVGHEPTWSQLLGLLVYILDPAATWKVEFVDRESDKVKGLTALKNELKQSHTVVFFKDCEELSLQVLKDVLRKIGVGPGAAFRPTAD